MNNKVTLPDGTVIERPAVATAEETTADTSGKKEAQAVKAAVTKEASKALPKTSAVK